MSESLATQTKSDRKLLEELVVRKRGLGAMKELLRRFNTFEAIGAVRSELRHSDFLAYLFNPLQN